MSQKKRPIAYILASSNHGTMIVNRNDYRMTGQNQGYGVGYQILNSSSFDPHEIDLANILLKLRQHYFGKGVVALDCGANLGVHTIEWSRTLHGSGKVIAFEAQEHVYYALAGNIAINNCFNASAYNVAVGSEVKKIRIPAPDYLTPASFGSLELKKDDKNEFIGQKIDYTEAKMSTVNQVTIDSYELPRVDFIKIDVEGMELDVLAGAAKTIERSKPAMLIEIIKTDKRKVIDILKSAGYSTFPVEINVLALHKSDPILDSLTIDDGNLIFKMPSKL